MRRLTICRQEATDKRNRVHESDERMVTKQTGSEEPQVWSGPNQNQPERTLGCFLGGSAFPLHFFDSFLFFCF